MRKMLRHGVSQDVYKRQVVYSAPMEAYWTAREVWLSVNPSFGKTVDIEYYAPACENAKQNPAEEMQFRQLYLRQWTNSTVRWMPMDKWDVCAFPVSPERLQGRVCYAGQAKDGSTGEKPEIDPSLPWAGRFQ